MALSYLTPASLQHPHPYPSPTEKRCGRGEYLFAVLFFQLLLLLTCFIPPTFACTVTDDAGNRISLTKPARRIISLSPDLTELVFAVGAGKSVVGVVTGSDYPTEAKKIRRVGDYHALDVEAILALHPDLILAWGESHSQQLAVLKRFSIPIFVSHTHHLVDIPSTMQRLGCLAGKEEEADRLARRFVQQYAYLKQKYKPHPDLASRVRVFYEVASHPLITLNQESWINDAIELCGGTNIFASTGLSTPFKKTAFAVSTEAVIRANPQVVIADLPPGWQQQWQAWPSIAAVRNHHLVSINPDLLERAGPRILDGVEALCQAINTPSPTEKHRGRGDTVQNLIYSTKPARGRGDSGSLGARILVL